jgi:hypothetical protein
MAEELRIVISDATPPGGGPGGGPGGPGGGAGGGPGGGGRPAAPGGGPPGPPTPPAWDPAGQLRQIERRKQEAEALDAARRRADPVYEGRRHREDAASIAASLAQMGLGRQAGLGQAAGLLLSGGAGGGAARLAGALGKAAAGPVGLALAAADLVTDQVRGAIARAGEHYAAVARLDTAGVAKGFEGLAEQVPIVGKLFAETSRQMRQFLNALDETARRLAPYSGAITAAQAAAEVRAIEGDVRRAGLLGDDLAAFVEARSRLEETGQDLLAKMLKPLIPMATRFIEWLTETLTHLSIAFDALKDFMLDGLNAVIRGINALIEAVTFGAVAGPLREIARNTRPPAPPPPPIDQQLDELRLQADWGWGLRPGADPLRGRPPHLAGHAFARI